MKGLHLSAMLNGATDHWYDFFGVWTSDNTTPPFTGSLDAAVALCARLLPGWDWLKKSPGMMTVYKPPVDDKAWARHIDGVGATDALALVSATLRSLSTPAPGASE